MFINKMNFYKNRIKKDATKLFLDLFPFFKTISTKSAEKNYLPDKKSKTLAPLLSFAFFFIIIVSVFLPQTAHADIDWISLLYRWSGAEALNTTGNWMLKGFSFTADIAAKPFKNALMWFTAEVAMLFFTLFSLLLIVAGAFFDFIVNFTIVDLSNNITSIKGGLNTAWTVLRDLANMLFIFVLLYVSIATILQLSSVDTKRMLKNVIVVALLINFSVFFTQIIIDVTNTVAVTFYSASVTQVMNESSLSEEKATISTAFMNATELLASWTKGESASDALKKMANGSFSSLMGLILTLGTFQIVLSFVLFAGAFFLVVRFLMFIILIIVSPLAFVSAVIPQTAGAFHKWFKSLANNAIFAPIFMAMIWVSLVMLQATNPIVNIDGDVTVANAIVGKNGQFIDASGAIFQVILAIGFLFASLLIAKSLSIQGASKVTQAGKYLTRRGFRAGVGATGAVVNRTAGRWAASRADNRDLKERASSKDNSRLDSSVAKMQLVALDKISKMGKKGGYRGVEERRRQTAKKRASLYSKTSDREKDRIRNMQEQAKASGNPEKIKAAQQERDRVLGVDSKELQKREKTLNNLVNQELDQFEEQHKMKIEEIKKENEEIRERNELRKKEGKDEKEMEKEKDLPKPLTNDALQLKKRELLREKRNNMTEKEGKEMQEQLSEEQRRQNEYVRSLNDTWYQNRAHIREFLSDLRKEEPKKEDAS